MKKLPAPADNSNKQADPCSAAARAKLQRFPIVAIGASAGGLEALEQFLRHVPADSGLAFVVIQHLDPTHKAMLTELLQRATRMKTFQVKDRMQVKPNCIYVIPPNKDMSILRGTLHLFEPTTPRGLRLPIDYFFRSLAEDRREKSIGVILSGMGSDGTLGLKAIKENAGLTLVQEPSSAKFDSMPRSAIAAGLGDLIAPAVELPGKIIDYLRHVPSLTSTEPPLEKKDLSALEKVIILLRNKTGQDFSLYKTNTVRRRIERRKGLHHLDNITDYVRYLQHNPQEVELLFKELLIGVTNFFRDSEAWELLRSEVLPALLDKRRKGVVRAWSVGCSSGEEAYSLAIVLCEAINAVMHRADFKVQVFATDLDQDAIDKARRGWYPSNIAVDVSAERLSRFFVEDRDGYRIGKEIREMVTFATQNVIMDPPFTKLDILICRNLLIYLTPELQKKLLPLFHYSLKPDGILFLGNAETISSAADLFTPVNPKLRLFRRRSSVLLLPPMDFPASYAPSTAGDPKEPTPVKTAANLQSLTDALLLQYFSPPAVLVNAEGDILYINGRTGKYLEPAAGKANWNIFAMARQGLNFDLGVAFHKVLRQQETLTIKGLKIETDSGTQALNVTLKVLKEPETLRGMVLIVFYDVESAGAQKPTAHVSGSAAAKVRITELEQEIQKMREMLSTTREEMQSSQEELKATNEELQSANEELQSTNEELTTSKEEMQSLNEELQTVNAEQQAKMDDLTRAEDDLRNLLNSTEIITVFLDKELHVRRFTEGAQKIFKLIPVDVGRPLSDISSALLYPEMTKDIEKVQRTLAFSQREITTDDGRWYMVRIMPYRTLDDVIAGVVITFIDITIAKILEKELREQIVQLSQQLKGSV